MRPYFWLINFIGLIVPRRLRADWRQEWAAELENRETLLSEWDRLDWRARFDLSRRSLGAFFDALRLQPRRLEDEMFQDLRFGARMLAKSPGFTAAAVLTLALGIGANAAIFSMVDALVIRPLNLRELPRLVAVSGNVLQEGLDVLGISPADFFDLRRDQSVFADLTAYQQVNANLTGAGEAERVQTFQVSANFFRELSVEAALGRSFLPEEESPGRDQVAILSHTFWQHRFGADPQVIGKTIALDGRATTIIGVMPELFDFPRPVEIWTPLALSPADWNNRRAQYLSVIGRLKPGIEVATAQAEMKRLALKLAAEYPQTNTRRGINAELLSYKITNQYTRTLLWLLMGAVGFILLIACVNIANMQLARATTRAREIAIRAALGAGRGRIIRQLLTESLLLGIIGGLGGLALSFWFLDLLRSGIPADQVRYITGWETMVIDSRVVLFNFAVSFLGGLIFGLAPAWQFSKPDLSEALKEGGRGSIGGKRQRMRNLLIISEVALALVLLVGAGLLGRGFMRMVRDQKTGFNPTNVMTMRTTLTTSKYREAHQITAFYQQALARLSTLAGVESASAVYFLPASGSWDTRAFTIEGRPALQPGESRLASYQVISANYFQTMRIPLQRGREFSEQDGEREPRVAIISESLARRYFPGEDPLGRRIAIGASDADNSTFAVVGVVGDVSRFMFDREPEPTLYLPHAQASSSEMYFAVRTAGDPVKLLDSMSTLR